MALLKDIISIFVYCLSTPFRRKRKAVLVYHSVGDMDAAADPYKMNVPPRLFEDHAAYIAKRRGDYTITFDDGFEAIFKGAFPAIKRYGLNAVLFVTTGYIDGRMDFKTLFKDGVNPKALSWDEIRDMARRGIEIGSHGVTHSDMAELDASKAAEEAAESKGRIEDMTGCKVRSFSYPFGNWGSFDEKTEEVLKSAGYERGYTNVMGMDNSDDEPFEIRRIRIYGTDNMFRFRLKLAGAYNWVDCICGAIRRRRECYEE